MLHLITRTGMGGTLVDLDSGRRKQLRVEQEVWFDPARGEQTTIRFGGRVVERFGVAADEPVRLRAADMAMQVFTRDYRDALRSRRARVLRQGSVDGIPVYWIRLGPGRFRYPASPCGRGLCQYVAISRETYEPVLVRFGPRGSPYEQRVLELESLPAGSGRIRGGPHPSVAGSMPLPRRRADRALARRLLGRPLAWPGRRVGRLRLAGIEAGGERPLRPGPPPRPRFGAPNHVISLLYGPPRSSLVVNEARRPTLSLARGPMRLVPGQPVLPAEYLPRTPERTVLLMAGGRRALLRRGGLVISVNGSTPAQVRAVLRKIVR